MQVFNKKRMLHGRNQVSLVCFIISSKETWNHRENILREVLSYQEEHCIFLSKRILHFDRNIYFAENTHTHPNLNQFTIF